MQHSSLFAKRALQTAIALCGLVPVSAGLYGVLAGPAMLAADYAVPTALDSHCRYLSGLLLGIGLLFYSTIPNIDQKSTLFRALSIIVVIGGIGRLYALITVGVPNGIMLFAMIMELIVTPCLALWQNRIARSARGYRIL